MKREEVTVKYEDRAVSVAAHLLEMMSVKGKNFSSSLNEAIKQ